LLKNFQSFSQSKFSTSEKPSLQAGFTLLEAALGALLLAAFSLMLLAISSIVLRGLEDGRDESTVAAQALLFDKSLRKVCSRVQIPFWQGDFRLQLNAAAFSCNYLDGFADAAFELKQLEAAVQLLENGTVQNFQAVSLVRIRPLLDSDIVKGLIFEYRIHDRDFSTSALFSGYSLRMHDDV